MKAAKKRIGAVLVAACLILSIFPTTAFAVTGGANGADTTTGVFYTAQPTFTIDIPQDLNIPSSGHGVIDIVCTHNTLDALKMIYVKVDTAQTLEVDGNFYLTSTTSSEKIKCSLWLKGSAVSDSNNEILKIFGGDTGDSGQIEVSLATTSITPGNYAGTIYFTITVE